MINKDLNEKKCWKVCWKCWNVLESGFVFPTLSNKKTPQNRVNLLNNRFVGMLESEKAFFARKFEETRIFLRQMNHKGFRQAQINR